MSHSIFPRYEIHRETLELHLQNNKFRITADFPSDKERSSACLQEKLTDLQVIIKNIIREVYLLLENNVTISLGFTIFAEVKNKNSFRWIAFLMSPDSRKWFASKHQTQKRLWFRVLIYCSCSVLYSRYCGLQNVGLFLRWEWGFRWVGENNVFGGSFNQHYFCVALKLIIHENPTYLFQLFIILTKLSQCQSDVGQ